MYLFLTLAEGRFLDAAVSRLIPADELGPGAKEAGVTFFIDRQLLTGWGLHARNYRQGPWREGTAQQGYQLPLNPQQIYRGAIRDIDSWCNATYRKPFSLLAAEAQDKILGSLSLGEIELESVPAKVFFSLLLKNTKEGFFSDPIHGGNRGKVGWKLLGFPGVASAAYADPALQNERYRVEPVSVMDVEEGRVKVDAQGYPIHIKLVKGN